MLGGKPHGTWSLTDVCDRSPHAYYEYRNGDLVDVQLANGARVLNTVNLIRSYRGLRALTAADFEERDTARIDPP
jgi:hypothetical protein